MKLRTICPYCDHHFKHDYDTEDMTPGTPDEQEVECPECKKEFCGEVTISVEYWVEEYPYEDGEVTR